MKLNLDESNNSVRISTYVTPEESKDLVEIMKSKGAKSISQYVGEILRNHIKENKENKV